MSEGKDIMSINKEKLRPIVRDISTTPHSYILEDEDVTIPFSLERKQESIKNILNNEGNEQSYNGSGGNDYEKNTDS